MFAPVRINKPHAGLRLQPLQKVAIRLPAFDNSGYVNPALKDVDFQARKLRCANDYIIVFCLLF